MFAGPGAATIDDIRRGRLVSTRVLGDDIEVVIDPITTDNLPTNNFPTTKEQA
jgi:hypothetical protein